MKRLIDEQLFKWKKSLRRKPLILRGGRQVGKTWSIRKFGETHFDTFAFIDLERNPDWHRIFVDNLNAQRICNDLEIVLKQRIIPGKTLLCFDEIQACPRAIMALRYFYEEMPDLHVIAAGSLLEFVMTDISMPVGRIQFLYLYPLTFIEYLMAGSNQKAVDTVLSPPCRISKVTHDFLISELRRYFFIGGMPESVKAYLETGSMQESFNVQAEICETYRWDFSKYKPHVDNQCLNTVLTMCAQSVGKQIKYSGLAEGYGNPTIKKAFHLLAQAKIIKKVPAVNPSATPLEATASHKVFKSIMIDIGLMRYLSGMSVETELAKTDLLNIFRGTMAEQFAGQEILSSQKDQLYYWSRQAKSSTAEVDFVANVDNKIFPIEVKSGASGRLKSLHLFLSTYTKSPHGIVFSERPYEVLPEQKLVFIPLYFVFSFIRHGISINL
ncbi:MAG: ATP-binding protein [Spirochaetes bacterium]|nr:ATP-binding protein [Spirochaetota bacterium]